MSYPKKMVHPNYHKAKVVIAEARGSKVTAQGEPDRFPPVWVNNDDQEAYERSRGYHEEGEQMSKATFHQYPLYMIREKKNGEGHSATEELLVNSVKEEDEAKKKGFSRVGSSNPKAYENAIAEAPPDDYKPEQYPKYLGQDANGRDIIVNSREEELLRAGPPKVVDNENEISLDAKALRSAKMKAAWAKRKAAKAQAEAQA